MDGWREGGRDGWTEGWMDGWTDGRMDGWTFCVVIHPFSLVVAIEVALILVVQSVPEQARELIYHSCCMRVKVVNGGLVRGRSGFAQALKGGSFSYMGATGGLGLACSKVYGRSERLNAAVSYTKGVS